MLVVPVAVAVDLTREKSTRINFVKAQVQESRFLSLYCQASSQSPTLVLSCFEPDPGQPSYR